MLVDQLFYDVEAASQLTGLSAYTLRNWERRFSFPRPVRRPNGYRSYSLQEIRTLKQIAQLLKQGRKVQELMELARKGLPLPESSPPALSRQLGEPLDLLFQQLMSFDIERAAHSLAALTAGLLPRVSIESVFQPLFERIGSEWENKAINIAQEHFAATFLRHHLAPFISGGPGVFASRRKAICATLDNELHEGGLMLITIQLKLRGWSTYYLGPSLPFEELSFALGAIRPQLICLSCSRAEELERELPRLATLPALVSVGGPGLGALVSRVVFPENVIPFTTSASDAADLLDSLSPEYLERFRSARPRRRPGKR